MITRSFTTKILFSFFLLLSFTLKAEKKTVSSDSSSVAVRKPSPEKQKDLFGSSDFVYDRKPERESLWDRIKEWFWRNFSELFNANNNSWTLFFIRWGIVIAAVVIVILLLIKADVRSVFYGKSASNIAFSEMPEDINAVNFDVLIAEALKQKNYRKAVRLHFLKILKQLSEHNLIEWRNDKTNYDYYVELMKKNYHNEFREVSFYYEHIWYGDFRVTEDVFGRASQKFSQFSNRLGSRA